MNPNQETRAYVVHTTAQDMQTLFQPTAYATLDISDLRLVLEAARWAKEARDDYFLEEDEKSEWDATGEAIANIESLIK